MTIRWRLGQFVLGIFIITQAAILVVQQLPINPEAIQATSNTLLNNHLHQRLPEYYYKVSENTEVWSSPFKSEINVLLDTLFSGSVVTVLDSNSISEDLRWLRITYEDEEGSRAGWIAVTNNF